MTSPLPDRETVRAYLLETLGAHRRTAFELRMQADPDLRRLVEQEHAALAKLDALPEPEPPAGLADAVLRRVHEEACDRKPARVPKVWREVLVTAAVVIVMAVVLVPVLSRLRESARQEASRRNLEQLGIALKMYAGENRGAYPPVAPYPGVWAPDLRVLFPDYLSDPEALVNPGLRNAATLRERLNKALGQDPPDWRTAATIAAQSYTYTGRAMKDGQEALEVAQRREAEYKGLGSSEGLEPGAPLLKEGVERFFITDINNPAAGSKVQSTIPVLFESSRPKWAEKGRLVLYMDGHVEWVPYGEAFPAVEEVDRALSPPPPG